jgi:hypothetical protein
MKYNSAYGLQFCLLKINFDILFQSKSLASKWFRFISISKQKNLCELLFFWRIRTCCIHLILCDLITPIMLPATSTKHTFSPSFPSLKKLKYWKDSRVECIFVNLILYSKWNGLLEIETGISLLSYAICCRPTYLGIHYIVTESKYSVLFILNLNIIRDS